MIRGVHKRVIEITKPDQSAFERVLIFLNPKQEPEETMLVQQAEGYVGRLAVNYEKKKLRWRRLRFGLQLTAAALAGSMVTCGLLLLIQG